MTEIEKKIYDYAVSVNWDREGIYYFIDREIDFYEFKKLPGEYCTQKADNFIKKFKPTNEPTSIAIPIEDYNRLKRLEIKQQIKKLKKELKKLRD